MSVNPLQSEYLSVKAKEVHQFEASEANYALMGLLASVLWSVNEIRTVSKVPYVWLIKGYEAIVQSLSKHTEYDYVFAGKPELIGDEEQAIINKISALLRNLEVEIKALLQLLEKKSSPPSQGENHV